MPVETPLPLPPRPAKMSSDTATCLGVGDKTVPKWRPTAPDLASWFYFIFMAGAACHQSYVYRVVTSCLLHFPPAETSGQMLCTIPPSSSNQEPPLQIFLSDKQVEMDFRSHTMSTPELRIGVLCVD